MTTEVEITEGRGARLLRRVSRLAATIAVLTFANGSWQIGVWANHWYVAEQLYRPSVGPTGEDGASGDVVTLLRTGNEAVLQGGFLLVVTALLIGLALGVHRIRTLRQVRSSVPERT